MFADSLLDSPLADRSRRGWTTLISFTAQMLGLGILLTLPLLYTEGLPTLKLIATGAPISALPEAPRVAEEHPAAGSRPMSPSPLIVVRRDYHPIGLQPADPVGSEAPSCQNCLPGLGDPTSTISGILNSPGSALPPIPVPPKPVTKPPIVSHMMEGNLVYRVQPNYPGLARSARVQGSVVLRAVISRSGTIENLQVLSGHPLLTSAAIEAVRQWRYRPYILNGEPVEVETQITVNFLLAGN
jgi:periplasmic protein TonB